MSIDIFDTINPFISGKRALIFDVDGTLLDSMTMWSGLDIDYLESMGYKPDVHFCNRIKMMTINDAACYIKDIFGVDKSSETIASEIMNLAQSHYEDDLLLKEGAYDLICKLKKEGYHLVVATANEYDMIKKCLERNSIMEYFDGLITCTMVGCGKHRPDVYLKACEIAGVSKEEAVVFEDSYFAITTAVNAGFDCIGVYDATEDNNWDKICELTKCQVVFKDVR